LWTQRRTGRNFATTCTQITCHVSEAQSLYESQQNWTELQEETSFVSSWQKRSWHKADQEPMFGIPGSKKCLIVI
jgi:hypothetical protein